MDSRCIILVALNDRGGVVAIHDDRDEIEVFPTIAHAEALATEHFLLKVRPYQIVELDI